MEKITIQGNSLAEFETALQVFLDTTPTNIHAVLPLTNFGLRIVQVIIYTP